ncbi:sulfotransferase family protein [Desulfatitalea tepidiphila]|uniref:sulfotransferase family protein n=1 Tax=Desulfatitalea tepidiphila TaxID=1185843 RepID=UPI0006B45AAE|nr:sulfotransferase [Desulfatitalea tepidiphila]
MKAWIYIAGRGHSGSTMLDGMLGNADSVESLGELVSGMGRYEALCSCGEAFSDCPFWSGVRRRYEMISGNAWDDAVRASVKQAHIRNLLWTIMAKRGQKWVNNLAEISEYIAEAVCLDGKCVIVDSSKEITRALFLLRFVPSSRVIHLVRHPARILESNYHRLTIGHGFKFLRRRFQPKRFFWLFLLLSCVSWIIGNLFAEVTRRFGKERFLRVRYEDIIFSPVQEMGRIEAFAGINLCRVKEKIMRREPFFMGHNIGGNQMRMAGSFVFDPNKSSRSGLPRRYRLMAKIICWPLLRFYGYRE